MWGPSGLWRSCRMCPRFAPSVDLERVMAIDRRLDERRHRVRIIAAWRPLSNMEVRTFAPSEGVSEDPVCGSSNGAVAFFW